MPEGPEVKTIVDGLQRELSGHKITQIVFSQNGKYREKAPANFLAVEKSLPLRIKHIKCRGKFIYFVFSKDMYMGNSLGMSGIWVESEKRKHTCMTLIMSDKREFHFVDQRHFGCIHFYIGREELDKKLSTIGPDFLSDSIGEKHFTDIYEEKKRKNIVMALMDQAMVSGIGNYIKSEVLYRAKISPLRTVGDLSKKELSDLYNAIKHVTVTSYKNQGMSQENYVTLEGEKGKYVTLLKVYRQKKDPLGNKVETLKTKDGRTTYWVPSIQK